MPVERNTKDIIDRVNTLKGDRGNWEAWWQALAKYCLPRKAEITTRKASGAEFDADVYDSTAVEAVNIFASGLMGYLTNPSLPWFRLRTRETELMDLEGVREFFDHTGSLMHDVFHGSNFYEQLHEFYLEDAIFGTAGFYSEEDPRDLVRYYSRPIRELYFDEDDRGRLQTVYRVFELTARQAYGRWGGQAGAEVVKAYTAKKYDQQFEYIHCVGPRQVYDPSRRGKLDKPVHSIWISVTDKARVAVGGFEEQPFHIARASKVSGEKHGYSPAMNVLPDIRMANKIAWVIIRASMKATDPPVMLPHDQFLMPLDFNPAAVNYRLQRTGAGSDEQVQFLDHKGNILAGRELLNDTRETIHRGLFTDLFLMLQQREKTMTAFEVSELMGERMLILGPMLGRLQSELLEPVIVRTFNLLARQGRLGEIPGALLEAPEYQVEYVSVLARAQKLSQVRTIQTFMGTVGELAKLDPQVLDKINADEAVDQIAELSGIMPKILQEERVIAQKRQQRRQAQELATRIELAKAGAEAAKTGGEAAESIGRATGGGGGA